MYSRKNVAMKISLKMEAILRFNVSNVDVFLNSTVVCFGKKKIVVFLNCLFPVPPWTASLTLSA